MGLTHYWSFNKGSTFTSKESAQAYESAIRDCQKIVRAWHKVNGGLSGYTPHTTVDSYNGVSFNGSRENGHEPFILRESFKEALSQDDFCKTDGKPYDIVVRACLLALKRRLGDRFDLSSDCKNKELWQDAEKIMKRVLNVKNFEFTQHLQVAG